MTKSLRSLILLAALLHVLGCAPITNRLMNSASKRIQQDTIVKELRFPEPPPNLEKCLLNTRASCPKNGPDLKESTYYFSESWANQETREKAHTAMLDLLPEASDGRRLSLGMKALEDPALERLEAMIRWLAGQRSYEIRDRLGLNKKHPKVTLGREELYTLVETLRDATMADSWSLLEQTGSEVAAARDPFDEVAAAARMASIKGGFLGHYLRAYFRDGYFLQADLDPTLGREKLEKELEKLGLCPEEITKIIDSSIGKYLEKRTLIEAKSDVGLVARGGASYKFPTVIIEFKPGEQRPVSVSELDLTQIGADLLRVAIEALGDSIFGIPAVSGATGLNVESDPLELFQKCPAGSDCLSEAEFNKVSEYANQLDGFTGASVGQWIRGAAWISLNNEALAKIVESALGAVARKATEKVVWCWYACSPYSPDPKKPQLDTSPFSSFESIPFEVAITEPKDQSGSP